MKYAVDLRGKVAIVTGASRGIGRAIALELAKRGADVAVLARNLVPLCCVSSEIRSMGCRSIELVGDVTDQSGITGLFSDAYRALGSIDILVNNAGINLRKNLEDMDEQDWNIEIDTNLKGVFVCSRVAAEYMKRKGEGWIINISSIKGKEAATSVSYSASKSGVIGLTRSMAKQLIRYNIYVNCIAPGFIDIGMSKLLSADEKKGYLQKIPLSRFGAPEEIASVVCFLASPASSYIVGATINVNGGYLMD